MPFTVTLSDPVFQKLQKLAVPFVDTPESVIASLADAEIKRRVGGSAQATGPVEKVRQLDADRHPSLTHSRLIAASVEGKPLYRAKWNNLMDHLHVLAHQRLGSFDAVHAVTSARIRDGQYEEDGFHFLPEAGFSIQGVDSNLAWDHSLRLARHMKISIEAKLEWREKDGAAHPGEFGLLRWSPPNLAIA
jgi:hypothetical protein